MKGAATKAISGTYANDGTARGLLNVIRASAGKWCWSRQANAALALVQDNSVAMMATTPATITINYILAERSREYFGEATAGTTGAYAKMDSAFFFLYNWQWRQLYRS